MGELAVDVLEEIRRVARGELGFDGPIESSHDLREDLQLDSLGMTVVAVAVEDRYRIHLREEDAGALATVGDLVALVCRRVTETRGDA